MMDLEIIIESAPTPRIAEAMSRARSVLEQHRKCAVSVSGGSDSDTVLDLLELVRPEGCELRYVFFDTGLEYEATKRHLDELEQKYGVSIDRRSPRKTLPVVCREDGMPFISKDVTEMIKRLQTHGFDWNDTPENATVEKYGRCQSALDWYFNRRLPSANGKSKYNINRYTLLREFLMENAPDFPLSNICCQYAKKLPSADFNREYKPDLTVTGMRRAEGGRRAGVIKDCFSPPKGKAPSSYRPIWFWTDGDKAAYKKWRGLRYSDCYEVYGLKRTGCAGCPCNSKAKQEIAMIEPFEPQIAKAAREAFGASHDYRRRYAEFKANRQAGNRKAA